jgi:hypothetical protein
MCAADDTHQTSKLSLLTLKRCPIVVSRLIFQCTRNSCQMIPCFMSASVTNCLPARWFLRNPKKWKTLGARYGVLEEWCTTSQSQYYYHPPILVCSMSTSDFHLPVTLQVSSRLCVPNGWHFYKNHKLVYYTQAGTHQILSMTFHDTLTITIQTIALTVSEATEENFINQK